MELSGMRAYDYSEASLDTFVDVINGSLSNEAKEQLYISATVSYVEFMAALSTVSVGLGVSVTTDKTGQSLIALGDVAISGYVLYRTVLSGWDATTKVINIDKYDPLKNYDDIMENPREYLD